MWLYLAEEDGLPGSQLDLADATQQLSNQLYALILGGHHALAGPLDHARQPAVEWYQSNHNCQTCQECPLDLRA